MALNYFNYFTEIEEHFVRKRGRNLLISPLDWCLIELWKENGIPLNVVLRGIDRSFEKAKQKRKSEPRTLFYCHPAVMEAFEEYQEATVGAAATEPGGECFDDHSELSRESVSKFVDDLRRGLESRQGEAYARAASRLSALSAEIGLRAGLDLRQVDNDLVEISSMLTEALRQDLSSETWKLILAESSEEVKVYRKHLAPAVFEVIKQKQIERKLREYFDLPEFSLLHCD